MTELKSNTKKVSKKSAGTKKRKAKSAPKQMQSTTLYVPPSKKPQKHPYRKLYRSRSDKWIGGVSGGIAQYFKIDPVIVRISWVVLTLVTCGAGIIGYILFWLFVSKEPREYQKSKEYVTYDEYGNKHVHHHYTEVN